MESKNILITGGAGFVGSALSQELTKSYKVRIIDLIESEVENVESIVGNLLNEDIVKKSLEGIDVVCHLAAQIRVPYSFENPREDCEINVIGTINLLKNAKDVQRFIYGSTSSVYGEAQYQPADENHPLKPTTPYGLSKLCAEYYCQLYSQLNNFELAIGRLSSPYGPRSKGVIPIFFKRAMNNEVLKIFGTGEQKRAYLYLDDVVEAYSNLINKGIGVYNIGHNHEVSINELAEKIIKITESESEIIHETPVGIEESFPLLNTSKVKKDLGWEPRVSIDEGLQCIYTHLKGG